MGFKDARKKAIDCLNKGLVQAEERSDIREKNLLKTGVMSAQDVVDLLRVTRGNQHREESHRDNPKVSVHICEPEKDGESWHIKFYFLDPNCFFISVHKSHISRGSRGK